MSGWMKCWVVFSLSLLLDVSLPARWQCKAADLLKITFLAWCLAPLHLNGSDLLFDSVVVPVHWVITRAVELSGPPCHTLVMKVSQYILQPSLAALQQLAALLATNIYLIVSATPGEQNINILNTDTDDPLHMFQVISARPWRV